MVKEIKNELIAYTRDASRIEGKPVQVHYPTTAEEIQKIVREATTDIVPRGSGTNLVGGTLATNAVVIEMRGLNKIIHFDRAKQSVLVQAGVILKELNEKLHPTSYEFPICFNEQSTIGGMVANNCVGERSLRYGSMKDWINEIEFVNGKGELITIGRADLTDVCGMEGITGIIVKVKLRLMKNQEKSFSLFQSDTIQEVVAMARRLKLENEVVMLKIYPKKTSTLLGLPEKYNLIIRFDSVRGKIKGAEAEKIHTLVKKEYDYLYKNGYYESQDAKFFYDRIQFFMELLESHAVPYIADGGLAIINPFFKDDETEKVKKITDVIIKIGAKKGRYPIGLKRKYLIDPLEKKILLRIKKRHDPLGKCNREKVIDISLAQLRDEVPRQLPKKNYDSIQGEEKSAQDFRERLIEESSSLQLNEIPIQSTSKEEFFQETSPLVLTSAEAFKQQQERDGIQNIMTNSLRKESHVSPRVIPENIQNQTMSASQKNENDIIKSIMTNTFKKEELPTDKEKKDDSRRI